MSAAIFRPLHFVPSARKLSALTGKTYQPETAASCHYREKCGASRPWQFSADSGQDKDHDPAGGRIFGRLSSPFLRPPSPHRCCSPVRHRAELGSEIKNRASAAPFPNRRCHGFCVRLFFNALSRAARCLPQPRSEQQRQGDGQRFFKKAMKSPMFMREATAPASVRPSSVFKMGNFFGKGIL